MRASSHNNSRLLARTLPDRAVGRIETAAVYVALGFIAAIVFGTLSIHPF